MRTYLAVVLASVLLGACSGPCRDGANVLVRLDGDAAPFSAATKLALVLTIDGVAVSKQPAPIAGPFSAGTTVLLVPSVAPASATYMLGVTATLLDASDAPLATGSMTFAASDHACNRATLALTATSMPPDGSAMPDTGVDLAHTMVVDASMPDLQCVPSSFDEDGDTVSDPCDVCAANANKTPVDTDMDGVPDACDPEPTVVGNKVLLFEPFNVALTGWTGTTTESSGSLVMSGSDRCDAEAQKTAGVGAAFQLQTYVTPTSIGLVNAPDYVELGLYAIDAGGAAVGCAMQADSMGGFSLVLSQGDVLGDPNFGGGGATVTTPIGSTDVATGVTRRLRLRVHGGNVYCELATPTGTVEDTVVTNLTTAGTNFSPVLHTCYASATFSSVFAVSDP